MEFKGTKGKLERKYISGICIGIGTVGYYSEMTANSIIPDDGNDKDMEQMEADMLLYSKSRDLLDVLKELVTLKDLKDTQGKTEDYLKKQPLIWEKARQLIKSATELKEE